MPTPNHCWSILGVTRFTPAPNAPSYISSVNWVLASELYGRVVTRSSFASFGPDHPGTADLGIEELMALIRDPAIEAETEAELQELTRPEQEIERTYAAPFPVAEPEIAPEPSEIRSVEEPPVEAPAPPAPTKPAPKKRRARTKSGTFQADNPYTPDNEAWEAAQ